MIRTAVCSTGVPASLTIRIVTVKSGANAVIIAAVGRTDDAPANDAARRWRSGSMIKLPAAERRNAVAASSAMRTTAIGGGGVAGRERESAVEGKRGELRGRRVL